MKFDQTSNIRIIFVSVKKKVLFHLIFGIINIISFTSEELNWETYYEHVHLGAFISFLSGYSLSVIISFVWCLYRVEGKTSIAESVLEMGEKNITERKV